MPFPQPLLTEEKCPQETYINPMCPAGPKGPTGNKGVGGEDGKDGIPGQPGLDFAITMDKQEEDVYAVKTKRPCIKCPGNPGKRGEKGRTGPLGKKGRNGLTGLTGLTGQDGLKGEVGDNGLDGEPGIGVTLIIRKGMPGERGKPGEKGDDGYPGVTGLSGIDARRGARGETGEIGQPGPSGLIGPPGVSHKDPLLATKGIKSLVKRFKDELTKLDTLELALSSRGNVATPCVTIPKTLDGRLQVDGKKCFPHLFYYNIFVEDGCNKHEISSIPECKFSFEKKTDFICINPYHLFKGKDNFSLAKEYRIPSVEYGNPMSTGSSNPNSNMSNNPNSNMSNKPNSNMSVNPRSHCSINPGSNCSINPSSNGNMDPRSNISINPLSNSTIDPHSSMSINPNSNISNATSNSNTSTIKETQNSLEAELDIFEKIYEATSTMLGSSYGNTEQVTTSDFSSTITTETTPYTNHYKSASILSNANNSMNSSNEDSLGPRHSNNPTSTHSALPTQKNYDVTNSVQTYYPYSVESNQSPSLESALYLNSEETNDPTSVQSLYPNSVDPYLISEEYRYSAPPSHSTQTSLLSNQTSLINPFSVESGMTDNSSQPASNQTIYYMPEEYVPSEINESVEDGDCRKSNFPTNSSNLTIDKMIKGTNSDITKDSNVEIKDNTNVFITSMEDEIIQLTNEKVQTNDGRQVTTDNDVVNVPDNGDDNNFNSGINSLTNSTNNQNDEGSENNSDDDGPNKEFEKLFNGEEPMDEADIMYKPVKDELNVIKVLKVPGIYLNPIDGSNESKYPVFVQDTVDEMMTKKEKAEKDFGQDLYSRFNKVLTKAKQFRPLVPTTDYLNKSNEGRYFISALTKNEIKRKSIVFSNGYMEMEDISTITRPAPLDEIALLPTKCVCKLMQYSLGSSHHTSDAIGIDVTPFYIDGSECYGAKNRFNLKSDPRYLHSARRMEIIKQVGIDGVRIDSYKQDLFITNLSNVKIYVKGFRWLEQGQKEAIHCLHFGAVLKVFDMNEFVINLHANVDQQKLVCIANSFDAMELNDREVVEDDNAKPKRMHKKTGALQKMSHIEISIGERWGENTNYARCRDTPVGIEIVLNQQKSYLQRMINEARNEISLADIEWNTIC
uniref:MH1 domain-containing protein n=1 Tax=Rhabditophanes sp. KR3021 TaxID=114890 RepID=A0AC35U1Q2_9BILA